MSKKVKLDEIKVQSFVTTLKKEEDVKGGTGVECRMNTCEGITPCPPSATGPGCW